MIQKGTLTLCGHKLEKSESKQLQDFFFLEKKKGRTHRKPWNNLNRHLEEIQKEEFAKILKYQSLKTQAQDREPQWKGHS